MGKSVCKEWELFGPRYRVADAKIEKVDCKACQTPVAAATNRLQSHLRKCPGRRPSPDSDDEFRSSGTSLSHRIPVPREATDDNLSADGQDAKQSITTNVNGAGNNGPPSKRRRQLTDVDDSSLNSFIGVDGSAPLSAQIVSSSPSLFTKRRLQIDEMRLQLEIKRDEREERRERLQLKILETQARKEKLLADKEEVQTKVVLALARKQLRDQDVSEEEIDQILPIPGNPSTNSTKEGYDEDVIDAGTFRIR